MSRRSGRIIPEGYDTLEKPTNSHGEVRIYDGDGGLIDIVPGQNNYHQGWNAKWNRMKRAKRRKRAK